MEEQLQELTSKLAAMETEKHSLAARNKVLETALATAKGMPSRVCSLSHSLALQRCSGIWQRRHILSVVRCPEAFGAVSVSTGPPAVAAQHGNTPLATNEGCDAQQWHSVVCHQLASEWSMSTNVSCTNTLPEHKHIFVGTPALVPRHVGQTPSQVWQPSLRQLCRLTGRESDHVAGADAGGQLGRGGRDVGAAGAACAGDPAPGAERAAGAAHDLAGAGPPVEGAASTMPGSLKAPLASSLCSTNVEDAITCSTLQQGVLMLRGFSVRLLNQDVCCRST